MTQGPNDEGSRPTREPRLRDWGENRLLAEVVIPTLDDSHLLEPLGDDVAFVATPHDAPSMAVTTDAAPQPLVWQLAGADWRTWGWYAVVAVLSDLAAAGARPVCFASAIRAPGTMLVSELSEFYEGLADACRSLGVPNAGGDLREAEPFGCDGAAIGAVRGQTRIGRGGCRPGDVLMAIGDCGRFMAAFLRARREGLGALGEAERESLFRPRPRVEEMTILAENDVCTAASDASDGVLGALGNIAQASGCSIRLAMDEALIPAGVRAEAEASGIEPWNVFYCWGDWQVLVSVPPDRVPVFMALASAEDIPHKELGRAVEGGDLLQTERNGRIQPVAALRNENFSAQAYNSARDAHLRYMLKTPLVAR